MTRKRPSGTHREGLSASSGGGGRPRLSALWLALSFALLISCGGGSDDSTGPAPAPAGVGYTIRPEALWRTGPVRWDAEGNPLEWMLRSCRRITPLAVPGARFLEIDDHALPLGLAVHPAGKHVFLSTAGRGTKALLVIDIETGSILHKETSGGFFLGLAFRPPDGDEVYVSDGGRDTIETYAFDHETGELRRAEERDMKLTGFPAGLCVVPGRNLLLAVSQVGGRLTAFDLETAQRLGSVATETNPYAVAVHPGGQVAYVSCERASTVNVFDISDPGGMRRTASLETEKNPEALLLNEDGTRLYVTNADEDSLTVIGTGPGAPAVLDTIDLRSTPGKEYGSSPNAIAFSATTQRIYIAQARLHKLAVLDAQTGAHLGDIPTGGYPSAVALQSLATDDGPPRETLFVADGKGLGTPGPGDERRVPGRLSILPVPADEDLPGLTDLVAANNAFPGRLFDLHPGDWSHPIPRSRGEASPIKHVFLVIRENKTYDTLLGGYQPPEGHAEGEPGMAMEDYDRLLPNLYKIAERFAICDNYYSNAEASNQGHEMLTSTTVNTYVEKLVFADREPIPIELEMVFSPVAWPKKDFIFQHAIRNGIRFRDYGEAVGAGKDLLPFNPEYMHMSQVDPPWFHMFSRDEDKIRGRIEEWESPAFSGPNFPQLIVMLLPNDHTFGGDEGMPTRKSMISDNDLATGLFVEWLSSSHYWTESAAFITEDDPQGGEDHLDSHRTILAVVSPWVRRGYVSHVRYNEAHLYATMEYILGLPPLTIFDEVAQPMYDLFDFETDPEPYVHEPRDWPEEFNPSGTRAARASADMYFAEPDMAEGLEELELESDAERREAGRITNRLREKGIRLWRRLGGGLEPSAGPAGEVGEALGPTQVLETLVELAGEGDLGAFRDLLDADLPGLMELYGRRRHLLHATSLAEDPVRVVFDQFADLQPRPVSEEVAGDQATVKAVYNDGIAAELRFRREADGWKYHLSHHLASAVRIMGDTCVIKETFEAALALKTPEETPAGASGSIPRPASR